METSTLFKKTRDYLNVCQNNLIRQILSLHKFCHMSKILECLKVLNFEDLYLGSKLSFLNSIKNNELSSLIFSHLCESKNDMNIRSHSKSFVQDIRLLEKHFNQNIFAIYESPLNFKKKLKQKFYENNGVTDSINTCLNHYKSKSFKFLLDGLLKPAFIREDGEFQELIQYLIIAGYS